MLRPIVVGVFLVLSLACSITSASESLHVGVIGGSGMIGQRIAREALERGHTVTLIVRDASRITERHEQLKVMQGDVLDADAMTRASAGLDVLVSAVGAARAAEPDYSLYRRAAESLVTALRKLGDRAPRLIVVGGVGSLKGPSGALVLESVPKERLPEHLGQKAAFDFLHSVSDVRWTYVSPPARIAPGERTGAYRLGADELVRDAAGESRISMEDFAVAILDEIEKPRHIGKRFTVGY